MAGVQIGTHVNEWNLDAPALAPFWTAAEALGAAVFVHPWDMAQDGRMEKFWFPWLIGMPSETTLALCSLLFGGVLERHPRLRICFAPGGGSFAGTLGRIDHGFAARPDLCQTETHSLPSRQLRAHAGVYVDSLVHDPDALELLLRKFGPERVILGTDYPFPLGELQPGALIAALEPHRFPAPLLALGDKAVDRARARMLRDNALAFLGLAE